jgi:hypothetical protein
MKPGPYELAQQHPQRGRQNDLVMHQMMSCSREVGDRTINQFGADFRYAVEFSKYGRTPASVSRPAWGQPDLRYRLTATSPNRRCPAVPDSPVRLQASPLWSPGGVRQGVSQGRPTHSDLQTHPAAVRFPLGHGRSYGPVAASSNPQVSGLLGDHAQPSVQVSVVPPAAPRGPATWPTG